MDLAVKISDFQQSHYAAAVSLGRFPPVASLSRRIAGFAMLRTVTLLAEQETQDAQDTASSLQPARSEVNNS